MNWLTLFKQMNQLRLAALWQRRSHYPLQFSETELELIRNTARRLTPTELDLSHEVHYQLLGEQLSPFAKSGFEFAETRLYQPGDNVRFINWRRYANTGQLYVNTFHEERRPQCWIIVDRRQKMRFGTRFQLKLRQAALFALYYLNKALQHQTETGGIILEQRLSHYPAQPSQLLPFIQHINAASPPLTDQQEVSLSYALKSLQVQLPAGALIIICSDFHDITHDDISILSALNQQHRILALHIVDPAESDLPETGDYQLYDPEDDQMLDLDLREQQTLQQVHLLLNERLDEIASILKRSGCHYHRIASEIDYLNTQIMPDHNESAIQLKRNISV